VQLAVREWVAAVVTPDALRNDREERFPQEAFDGLKQTGFVGMTIPEEYGGGGADPLTYCLFIEELSRGDANVRSIMSVHLGLVAGSVGQMADLPTQTRAALLIGVDLGPNLSVTGSLATMLWLVALRREGEHVSALAFLRLGILVMPPALLAALWLL
jgi:alkylation response protein AidB-like acyl-CoA dehydrogenase